jgi:hypothetical protein
MNMRLHGSEMLRVTGLDELEDLPGWLYLSSPYSKFIDGMDAAYVLVTDISEELSLAGIKHFCPITVSHEISNRSGIKPTDHDFWMTVDHLFMPRAYGLVVVGMEGWEVSRGVAEEVAYFAAAEKPIYFLDPAIVLATE